MKYSRKDTPQFSYPNSAINFDFAPPIIKETNDYTVPLALLRQGLTIIIPLIPGASKGAECRVQLFSTYYTTAKSVEISDPSQDHEIRFEPKELVKFGGRGYVQYILFDPGYVGLSMYRHCDFQEAIPVPELKEYEQSDFNSYLLPSEAADNGFHIVIPPYPDMAEGDRVTVVASTTSEKSGKWLDHEVGQGDISHPLEFLYEPELLKDLRRGFIDVSASLSKGEQQYHSHPIRIELLPLLPDPEAVHQATDVDGNKIFLLVVEDDGSGAYAPVIQQFASELPAQGDEVMLVIHATRPHSYSYSLNIEGPVSEVLFKIPSADLHSLSGGVMRMGTLWRRANTELVVSPGQAWFVPGEPETHPNQQGKPVSKKR